MKASRLLAWSLGAGVLITVFLSVWAYASKEDVWEFRGSVKNLRSLDAEIRLLDATSTVGLTRSFIESEAANAKEQARKEGDSLRSLSLPDAYHAAQADAVHLSDTVTSSSEALSL